MSKKYTAATKKRWFVEGIAAVQAADNHWDDWGLTYDIWWQTCASIPTWT